MAVDRRTRKALRKARAVVERIDRAEAERERAELAEIRVRAVARYYVRCDPSPEQHADANFAAALVARELGIEAPRIRWFREADEDEAEAARVGRIEFRRSESGMWGEAIVGDPSAAVWINVERASWWAIANTTAHEIRHTVQTPSMTRDEAERDAEQFAARFVERLREEQWQLRRAK